MVFKRNNRDTPAGGGDSLYPAVSCGGAAVTAQLVSDLHAAIPGVVYFTDYGSARVSQSVSRACVCLFVAAQSAVDYYLLTHTTGYKQV